MNPPLIYVRYNAMGVFRRALTKESGTWLAHLGTRRPVAGQRERGHIGNWLRVPLRTMQRNKIKQCRKLVYQERTLTVWIMNIAVKGVSVSQPAGCLVMAHGLETAGRLGVLSICKMCIDSGIDFGHSE